MSRLRTRSAPLLGLLTLVLVAGSGAAHAQRRAPDPAKIYRMPIDQAPVRGPANALVTIVEFSDFQCPFCARAQMTLADILDRYPGKVRVVYRHQPLSFHQHAMGAAEAAMAAGAQGRFWEMHDYLFTDPRALDRATIEGYARSLQLDVKRFRRELDVGTHRPAILADMAIAERFGATGTPTFFINGRPLTGAQPLDRFVTIIDQELARAEAELAKGTPRARLYDALVAGGEAEAPAAPARPAERTGPDPDAIHKVPVAGSPMLGPATARITIVIFADYECPFCARVMPTIDELRRFYGGELRVVWKHMPLGFHPHARLASEAAAAAGEQGKFWEMHDLLMANQRALERDDLERHARKLGLNMKRFRRALDSGSMGTKVDTDVVLAGNLGVRGTPTSFVNGKMISGAQPLAQWRTVIDAEMKRADEALARGVKRKKLYETLVGL